MLGFYIRCDEQRNQFRMVTLTLPKYSFKTENKVVPCITNFGNQTLLIAFWCQLSFF